MNILKLKETLAARRNEMNNQVILTAENVLMAEANLLKAHKDAAHAKGLLQATDAAIADVEKLLASTSNEKTPIPAPALDRG